MSPAMLHNTTINLVVKRTSVNAFSNVVSDYNPLTSAYPSYRGHEIHKNMVDSVKEDPWRVYIKLHKTDNLDFLNNHTLDL